MKFTASGSPHADPEYLAFLEELKKEPVALPSAEAQAARRAAEAAAEGSSAPTAALTPLVALMLAQRGRGGQVSFACPMCGQTRQGCVGTSRPVCSCLLLELWYAKATEA